MLGEPHYLQNGAALKEFLAAFAHARLAKEEWTHAAHVAMAAVYLRRFGALVLPEVRLDIQRFNAGVGGPPTAYHESLTVLWLAIVDEASREAVCGDELSAARHAVALFGGDSKAHTRYYSYDVVKDDVARTSWVAPDVKAVGIRFDLT